MTEEFEIDDDLHPIDSGDTTNAEDRVVDLMDALEKSVASAKVAARRKEVREALLAAVQKSVTSASPSRRTVENPRQAAEYVVNMLTAHRPDLLALASATFPPFVEHADA